MANRSDSRSVRVTDLPGTRRPPLDVSSPSVPDSLEKLASATSGVITKRIDLFALEAHQLVASLVVKSALAGFGLVVALAAFLSGVLALVLWLMPGFPKMQQIGVFAGINAVIGVVVILFALRERPPTLGAESEVNEEAEEQAADSRPL